MKHAKPFWITLGFAAATAVILYLMGRNLICPCGFVQIWGRFADTETSSQHLFDWYTPSHLLHGLLFFGALWLVARRLSVQTRFVIALAVECLWEIVENSAWVIDRYRTHTVSFDYNGDSVVNATMDIAAMAVGFGLARALPVWVSVALVLGFEALTVALIRDGLALNILMLVWPTEAVLDWQQAR